MADTRLWWSLASEQRSTFLSRIWWRGTLVALAWCLMLRLLRITPIFRRLGLQRKYYDRSDIRRWTSTTSNRSPEQTTFSAVTFNWRDGGGSYERRRRGRHQVLCQCLTKSDTVCKPIYILASLFGMRCTITGTLWSFEM